jgi:hypothetical protein
VNRSGGGEREGLKKKEHSLSYALMETHGVKDIFDTWGKE